MTRTMTRGDVLRKCIVVFDAIKRAASKGIAGLEAAEGMEESFRNDCEICEVLREMLREMEAGEAKAIVKDWQKELMEHGLPERMVL